MEHLSLEIFDQQGSGSKYATLPDDCSITITDTSEVFGKGDVWSMSFQLNIPANAHIFGSAGDMHGQRLHDLIHKRRARLWVDGMPLYLGYLKLDDEVEVDADGNVDVGFESGQKTFDEMIEGAKANQVPLMGDVKFGVALWRKRWIKYTLTMKAGAGMGESEIIGMLGSFWCDPFTVDYVCDGEEEGNAAQLYPRMVFPVGTFEDAMHGGTYSVDCLNTDTPYDEAHPYCNVPLCYQKYGFERKDIDGHVTIDYSAEPEAQRGYEYMPANRVNSAPNFYVIYWLKALMKHLGIHIDENQMMDVEDLRRLFFVNTKCAYKEPKFLRKAASPEYGRYRFMTRPSYLPERYDARSICKPEESHFTCTEATVVGGSTIDPDDMAVTVLDVEMDSAAKNRYITENSYLHDAYATPDCFPDVDISEVIRAIESGFGIRLLFSDEYKRVRIVLLRNIFRSSEVQDIACDIVGEGKQENSKRGFRMTYGDIDDTQFHYKGFDDKLPHKKELWQDTSDTHDYSKWKLDASYPDLIKKVSAFDKTCYVTPNTGDAYGIKVDKDAKRYYDLHPSLFEYAGFMDAEDGDCTGDDETIETIEVGFKPAIMNDIDFEKEKNGETDRQRFALFCDDKMRPRRPDLNTGIDYNNSDAAYDVEGILYGKVDDRYWYANMMSDDGVVKPGEFAITSDAFADNRYTKTLEFHGMLFGRQTITFKFDGYVNEGYRLYLQDNFEPNDDGISPIETHDWGLTLGIMRGSGEDARIAYLPDPDDMEGNDTWKVVPGSRVTVHPDTCDSYGREWDYNGEGSGIGPDGRVSLKLRAEKPNPQFDPKQPEGPSNRRYLEITTERLKQRGLADQFYKEYSYWVRNARIATLQVRMEFSQLLSLDKTKKVRVGDYYGFVRKMQYTVSQKTGLGLVKMEVMYI